MANNMTPEIFHDNLVDSPLVVMQMSETLAYNHRYKGLYQYCDINVLNEVYSLADNIIDLYASSKCDTFKMLEYKRQMSKILNGFVNIKPSYTFTAFMNKIIMSINLTYADFPMFKDLVSLYAPYRRTARQWCYDLNLYYKTENLHE